MITGIGTDLCDTRRIANLLERYGERFKTKVFTDGERQTCDARANPSLCYAKRFAAKEAVAKAIAAENTGALSWHSVEVVNDPSGRPRVVLHGAAKSRVGASTRVHLSLSDDPPYAQAFAIAEQP